MQEDLSLNTMKSALFRWTKHEKSHTCFSAISSESTFDEDKTWMALSSSKIFPSDEERTSRILSSISFSCLLFSALCKINEFFSSSSSGLSLATTIPSSWSWRPSGVIMKFNSVTWERKSSISKWPIKTSSQSITSAMA